MTETYLLLGTNLGEKLKNLEQAVSLLNANGVSVVECSGIYETEAWGVEDQPSFLNQVILSQTDLSPHKLLKLINKIESEMGRVRHEKWKERLIDIDILYFGDSVLLEKDLKIPHPEIHNRRFTLMPIVEIAPQLLHPILGKTQVDLLNECSDPLKATLVRQDLV